MNPPSRAKSGRSAASARPSRSTSAPCSPSPTSARAKSSGNGTRPGARKDRANQGGLAEPVAQRGEVARAAAPEAEAGQGALDVGAAAQELAQRRPHIGAVDEELHRVEPRRDRLGRGQRGGKLLGEEPRSGSGQGAVDRGEEAAAAFARQGRHQFEVAPGGGVDLHDRIGRDQLRRGEMRRAAMGARLLGQRDIIDERAGRRDFGPAETAEPVERLDAVKAFEPAARRLAVEARVGERGQGRLPIAKQFEQGRARQEPLGNQDLARHDAREIGGERHFGGGGERKRAGRQIEPGEAQFAANLGDPGQVIVPARVEEPVLGQGAGGDDAHHRALDRPLVAASPGFGGILDLIADRHLEPGADEARQIGIDGMHRHAAHRDVGAVMPAAPGQRDVERRRRGDRVIEEQLIEIAHPEKQEAPGMAALDLVILRHDRAQRRCRRGHGRQLGIAERLCGHRRQIITG